jgi:hypothetical protein
VTTYEATLLAALLEQAVAGRLGKTTVVERAPGRRGGYDGAFLAQSLVAGTGGTPTLTCLLRHVATAPTWVLTTVLAAAPTGTAISPLLGRHQATSIALRTGRFSPSGGRCALSLRAACEVCSVDPGAVAAALRAWPSQYVACAVAACTRRRHGLAAAIAAEQLPAGQSVVVTLVVDAAPPDAVRTALTAGFPVTPATLLAALRGRPVQQTTLQWLLDAAPQTVVTEAVVAAATHAAAYDERRCAALEATLAAGGGDLVKASGSPQAMRCALMAGDCAALDMLVAAGGRLPALQRRTPAAGVEEATEAIVYAACRLRGLHRSMVLDMLVGGRGRRDEIFLRSRPWGGRQRRPLSRWACAMLAEADGVGAREFVRWAGPLLDAEPGWREEVHRAAAAFARTRRPDEYLALATAYGSAITPMPLAAMIGLEEADAEHAIQWLADCRPAAMTARELAQCAEWSSVAAMLCNAPGTPGDCPGKVLLRRPRWWMAMAATVLFCTQQHRPHGCPPELARLICSFVVSQARPAAARGCRFSLL